jgi:hypothetical protein
MVLQHGRTRLVVTVAALGLAVAGQQACGSRQTPVTETPPPPLTTEVDAGASEPASSGAEVADAGATVSTDAGAELSTDAGVAVAAADAGGPPAAADAGAPAPTYSGPPPYVNLRPPRVGQGLTADQITRVWRRNQAAITTCYTNQLATNPRAHGVLTARIEIIAGGTGTIDRLHLAPPNDAMLACIREVLGRFEWPAPRNQPSTEVNLQVDFAPTPPAAGRH